MNKLTNDDTRDIAIRCVDKLIELNLLDRRLLDLDYSWEAQDIIHEQINKTLFLNSYPIFTIPTNIVDS